MNDLHEVKMAQVLVSAMDRIFDVPPHQEAYAQTSRDLVAFLDAHRAYVEIPDGKGNRGCIYYDLDKGAFTAFRPDNSPISEEGYAGEREFGYATFEDALHAYIRAVSK